jgi:sensor histidine kinase regulating citrate/malate metabolism
MNNSVRYGKKVTMIHFTLAERDDVHSIVCEDDGEGISVDEKENLFIKGVGKDHGLGLFLSSEILSITGISIKEEGEEGKGANFSLTPPHDGTRTE